MAGYMLSLRLILKGGREAGTASTRPHAEALFGRNGSGSTRTSRFFTGGRNSFYARERQWHLSETGNAFIAGQLGTRARSTAVFAQWVNSYKRLVPGYEAPVYVAWSQRNPLGADPDPALQAGVGKCDAAPSSAARIRPATRTSPSPPAPRRARGIERVTSCPSR